MKKWMAAAAVAVLTVSGCKVDLSYDTSKLNTELTVLKGATFAVPSPDRITLDDIIDLDGYDFIRCDETGDYYVDFGVDPSLITVTMPEYLGGSEDIPIHFDPVSYRFEEIPGFLSGEDQTIEPDLTDLLAEIRISSTIPAEFSLSPTIETFRSGETLRTYHIDALSVHEGDNAYSLTENAQAEGQIAVQDLGKLLSPIPDELKISDLDINATASEREKVVPGADYDLTVSASVTAPICFSANSRIRMEIPLDAKLDLDQIGLKKAELYLTAENSIPLEFTLSLSALDGSGKVLETVRFNTEGAVIAANGTSDLLVTLTTDGDLRFESLLLELTAASNAEVAGIHFNRNQGISLKDLVLVLPDGIQVTIDS